VLACALVLALGCQGAPGRTLEDPFRVLGLETAVLAGEASRVAETATELARARLGLEPHTRLARSTLRFYPTFASFRAATQDANTAAPDAYGLTYPHTRTAHVTLVPCPSATLRVRGLTLHTRQLLAHEATHLACFDALPWLNDLPGWVVEGLADSVAHETMCALGMAGPFEEEPHSATRLAVVQELIAEDRLPRLEALLADRLEPLDFEQRYAARWILLEFLRAREAEACRRILDAAFRARPGDRAGARLRAAVTAEWTATELVALDAEFRGYVAAFEPRWRTLHGSFGLDGSALVTLAWPGSDSLVLRDEPVEELPFALEGRMLVHEGAVPQLHVVLAHGEESFHEVSFTAGRDVVFWRYGRADNSWTSLARVGLPALALALEQEVAFRIAVDAESVSILLDDALVLRVRLSGATLLGPWGLGARAGACGEWRELAWTQGR
jgi:hypothetical protein